MTEQTVSFFCLLLQISYKTVKVYSAHFTGAFAKWIINEKIKDELSTYSK
jgi:hypothetical protein